MTIFEFLLARYAEEEQAARDIAFPDPGDFSEQWILEGKAEANRWMLAECAAKRRLVLEAQRLNQPDPLRRGDFWRGAADTAFTFCCMLALPYAEHPDYREEWRP